jgi:hypothetical protein
VKRLPVGSHFVCVVSLDVKASRGGGSQYLAVTLYAFGGQHVGNTFVDRLHLWSTNDRAVKHASDRFAQYCGAVGVDPGSPTAKDSLYFRPMLVSVQKDKSDQLKIASVQSVPTAFQAKAEADCALLRATGITTTAEDSETSDSGTGDELVIHTVASVAAVPLRWLWPNRFALGKVSIIAGDPGLGKSQLTAFLASVVTNGSYWPNGEGGAEQGDVVMLSCEDDLADTIRPRLEAAGADLNRVHTISAVTDTRGKRRSFNLSDDIAKLEYDVLAKLDGRARLVIIDPITAYMGRKVDNNGATEVRDALNPVQDLAARYGVAVVCVSHPPKNAGHGKAVNAVIGSQAYVAATRAAWMVTRDPENDERRLLLQVKNNLGNAKGLAFSVQTRPVSSGYAPYIAFEQGYVNTTADDALRPQAEPTLGLSKMDKAKALLHRELTNGPADVSMLAQHAADLGISYRTLKNAADAMKLVASKNGMYGGWTWGFPISQDQIAALFSTLPG